MMCAQREIFVYDEAATVAFYGNCTTPNGAKCEDPGTDYSLAAHACDVLHAQDAKCVKRAESTSACGNRAGGDGKRSPHTAVLH
jgi:hypothetical protein